ncbi:aldo/keto reductase [Spiroplasma endosymbiont of Lonchoptera lutea]|uniref:aldo/keto reductase n=1 Tax=Spiroplasma endosymbiont of Lonchoptera lutea TaxID=3066297 RepID=UPI0030CE2E13
MKKRTILDEKVKLHNGIMMPVMGFGTYKIENNELGKEAILEALNQGYRHIDTAKIYGNEEIVGQAIKESKISRSEIFVTTKLWGNELTKEQYLQEIDSSLEKLGLEFVDLFLMHWPWNNRKIAWEVLEEIYRAKKARVIGVSNFNIEQLEQLKQDAKELPVANQIEFHPGLNQTELRAYHQKNNIITIGWGTMKYHDSLPETCEQIAREYNKTIQQLFLRWAYQHQSLIIPKSMHKTRIIENSAIDDFKISDEHMKWIDSLPQSRKGPDPNNFDFGN